jgi:UDP-glucose 4-epimerase
VRVLVTGGTGFIGTYVCTELASRGHEPLVFDRHRDPGSSLPPAFVPSVFEPVELADLEAALDRLDAERDWRHKIKILPPDLAVETWPRMLGDIRDATAVSEAVAHVDGVIHLAGVLGTQETIANPRPAAETNVLGGLNVLEACAQYGTPLVNIAVGNYREYSTYSITKTTVERFATMYARHRDLPVVSVRALNAYGPRQSVSQPYGTSRVRKIIPSFVSRLLHHDPIEIYGDGSQIMDMIYAPDVARVLVTALDFLADGAAEPGSVFEAGTGCPTTVNDIADAVVAEVRRQVPMTTQIRHLPMRAGETPGGQVLADTTSLAKLGVDPAGFTMLEDGLRDTVTWYRETLGELR